MGWSRYYNQFIRKYNDRQACIGFAGICMLVLWIGSLESAAYVRVPSMIFFDKTALVWIVTLTLAVLAPPLFWFCGRQTVLAKKYSVECRADMEHVAAAAAQQAKAPA
jgi:hypothetical protein